MFDFYGEHTAGFVGIAAGLFPGDHPWQKRTAGTPGSGAGPSWSPRDGVHELTSGGIPSAIEVIDHCTVAALISLATGPNFVL